jgi:hypothetical protein
MSQATLQPMHDVLGDPRLADARAPTSTTQRRVGSLTLTRPWTRRGWPSSKACSVCLMRQGWVAQCGIGPKTSLTARGSDPGHANTVAQR